MGEKVRYVVRMEGVNFHATIEDNNNLAVIRGASLALLTAPKVLERALRQRPEVSDCDRVFMGASKAAFSITLDAATAGDAEALEALRSDLARAVHGYGVSAPTDESTVLRHMRFMVDLVPQGDDLSKALRLAEADNRRRQMQEHTVAFPTGDERIYIKARKRPCPVDRVRPIGGSILTEAGRWPGHELSYRDGGKTAEVAVSASVAARMDYGMQRGRGKRLEHFYREDIGMKRNIPVVTDDFSDLLTFSDSKMKPKWEEDFFKRLPESLHSKIAVIYADGNGFGDLLKKYTTKVCDGDVGRGTCEFGDQVKRFRGAMMEALVDHLGKLIEDNVDSQAVRAGRGDEAGTTKVHLETILWGADEMMWVLPAWMAWDFARHFFDLTKDWHLGGLDPEEGRLTHAMGIVTCDVKTPIRQAKALAQKLAEEAKVGMKAAMEGDPQPRARNIFQMENLESIDLPNDYLGRHRRNTLGVDAANTFTMQGGEIETITRDVVRLKKHFPRSQLYRLLRLAVRCGALQETSGAGVDLVLQELQKALRSQSREEESLSAEEVLGWAGSGFGAGASPILPLAVLAQVWDYIDPLDKEMGGTNDA